MKKKLAVIINVLALSSAYYIQTMEERNKTYLLSNISAETIIYKFKQNDIPLALEELKKNRKTPNERIASKMIGRLLSKDKDSIEKDIVLETIVKAMADSNDRIYLPLLATILVHAGANPNMVFMGESLLHKALLMNVEFLIKALFEHNVDYRYEHFLIGPIFFDAPTIEIAQLFIDKGIDVNKVNGNGHNVLWHVIDPKFSPELMRFYLERTVDVAHICKWDGSCVLHSFAANHDIKNENDFLTKARLVLKANPAMVNTLDHNQQTPITLAEKTIELWKDEYPSCVNPLKTLIYLFEYNQKAQ